LAHRLVTAAIEGAEAARVDFHILERFRHRQDRLARRLIGRRGR
jgi:hypothetical protein